MPDNKQTLGEKLRQLRDDEMERHYRQTLAQVESLCEEAAKAGYRSADCTVAMLGVPEGFRLDISALLQQRENLEVTNYTGDQREPADSWTVIWKQ